MKPEPALSTIPHCLEWYSLSHFSSAVSITQYDLIPLQTVRYRIQDLIDYTLSFTLLGAYAQLQPKITKTVPVC